MSPPYIYQPYHSAHNKTDEAAIHIVFQLNLSLFDAIHVPRVCTESFAITEYAANRKPTAIQRVTSSIVVSPYKKEGSDFPSYFI